MAVVSNGSRYDAIVIGSGFGGSVATTMLAEAGKKVLVLERGAWWASPMRLGKPPNPITMVDWLRQVQAELKAQGKNWQELLHFWPRPDHERGVIDLVASIRTRFNPNGLYRYSRFEEAHIPTANGVGGGSLIYSNVTLEPDSEVLSHIDLRLGPDEFALAHKWMTHFRGPTSEIVTKIPFVLPQAERQAWQIGDLVDLDDAHDYLYLDKSRALKSAAQKVAAKRGISMPWAPLPLSIIDYDPGPLKENPPGSGRFQPTGAADRAHTHCERQGRYIFGCLPQARHTLNKTLYSKVLTDTRLQAFVTLKALAEVQLVKSTEGGYEVTYRDSVDGGRIVNVSAPSVFFAAGTLGTSELLLRCQEAGTLELSPTVGHGFSTNGDFGGFAILPDQVDPVYSARGPINTCHVPLKIGDRHITVEDAGLPSLVAEVVSIGLNILDDYLNAAHAGGRLWAGIRRWWFKFRVRWLFWRAGRHLHRLHRRLPNFLPKAKHKRGRTRADYAGFEGEPLAVLPKTTDPDRYQTEAEMVSRIFFFNTMGQDDANGRFSLKNGKLDLNWDEPVTKHPVFEEIAKLQKELAEAMGGRYLSMPLWEGFADKKLVIPHPLGGCRIGRSRDEGVVDEYGRVFDGSSGAGPTDVLPGLYVVDGSAIPGALAVNPTLTITAQALKTMGSIVRVPPIVQRWGL